MGRIVLVTYRPKTGRENELKTLVKDHLGVLCREGLLTDRPSIIMQAEDASIVELFEWASGDAIGKAHNNPAIMALWQDFEKVCDYVPVADVAEAQSVFSEFNPLN